jgi:hypothetical protein
LTDGQLDSWTEFKLLQKDQLGLSFLKLGF